VLDNLNHLQAIGALQQLIALQDEAEARLTRIEAANDTLRAKLSANRLQWEANAINVISPSVDLTTYWTYIKLASIIFRSLRMA
jgi:hypothetical protein